MVNMDKRLQIQIILTQYAAGLIPDKPAQHPNLDESTEAILKVFEDDNKVFSPHKDNFCWGCGYRKLGEPDYINKCLLDENKPCIREE